MESFGERKRSEEKEGDEVKSDSHFFVAGINSHSSKGRSTAFHSVGYSTRLGMNNRIQ